MKRVMERKAADNTYLHRDFHISSDVGIAYVGERYGDNGVREYLSGFAERFYAPLVARIRSEGLAALREHILGIYEAEEADDAVETELQAGELRVQIAYCPAIRHMRKTGHHPSKWYIECTRTVNEVIATHAGVGFELLSYDESGGAAEYRFFQRTFL